jgi:hypothetical protein
MFQPCYAHAFVAKRRGARGGTEVPDYQCMREAIDNAGPRCQAIPGAQADTAISQLLLDTLTPLSLEVANGEPARAIAAIACDLPQ